MNKFRNPRDKSKFICYTCGERGQFARYFPRNKSSSHNKKGNKKRHHAHATKDDEPSKKKSNMRVMILQVMKNMF